MKSEVDKVELPAEGQGTEGVSLSFQVSGCHLHSLACIPSSASKPEMVLSHFDAT